MSTLLVALRSGQRTADEELLGFWSTTTPAGAAKLTRDLTTWLLTHHDRIATRPGAGAYFDEVSHLIGSVYARFPMEGRPHWKRPCEVCGELALTADWKPDAEIRDVTVWCESCTTVLGSTSGDGTVRTAGTDDGTAEQRAARRKLARIVKQIAVGTTVPRIGEVTSGG
jgi:hypothetical protein